ncbi:uncharacterized protein LOC129773617 [Toxorhynchites rutilus septentrionalis]|uniref:uncharacterized protein LOC129773617 n=1 Tax=Toxorhynchites rutilus septentrionalis TaxID=329112 RepID=UPI00247AF97D|nr:uncharacterized protein LOC129773617 [Toxorhynchites rutilus septentrionalis]
MDEALKVAAEKRKRMREDMEKKLKLAQMDIELENEKRDMQWAIEKKILEMKIATERAFNERREVERKKLQQDWDQLVQQRTHKLEKRTKKSKRNKARKEDTENPEAFDVGQPSNSTPKAQPGSSRAPFESTQLQEKPKNDQNARLLSKKKDDNQHNDVNDDESCTSESDSSAHSDNEGTEKAETTIPTKSQLSARQFLSRKLPTFTGRPDDWPMFFSSFETSTKACGFSNLENLARLQESLRGPARDAVSSRLLLPDSVPKVMETLRMLYGRPEQLLNTILSKIRKSDPPKSDKLGSFINFGVLVQQLCDHLEATNLVDHLVNPMLIQELVEKLPASTKIDWVRYKRQCGRVTLRTLADFLSDIVSAASEVASSVDNASQSGINRTGKMKANKSREQESNVYAHYGSVSVDSRVGNTARTERIPCPMCGHTNHRLRNCENFRKLSVHQRWDAIEKWQLCSICLNAHGKSKCKLTIRCAVEQCRERHNTLLHRVEKQFSCNTHGYAARNSILFRMAPIILSNGDRSIEATAFLDEGSSYTLVDSSITKQLKCKGTTQPLRVTWTAGVSRLEKDSQRIHLTIAARETQEKFVIQNVHTVDNLKLPVQTLRFEEIADKYRHLQGIPMMDYDQATPMILIGLKHIHLFAPLESRIGRPGEPIAVRSKLGWTVYGPKDAEEIGSFVGQHSCVGLTNQELHDLLKAQYSLDENGISAQILPESKDEVRAREILEKTTVRVGERFMTGLLWKEEDPRFPDSLPLAMKRMKSLEKRLSASLELSTIVRQQIIQYQQKGYCHQATREELEGSDPNRVWYLPLNIVLNPKKPSKVRLVWDAAAVVKGVSLNSKLLNGPDNLTPLPAVICKFREHLIGFGGDIREMFHQIEMQPADKQALRFVFDNVVYVMDRAIFGATCSPCSAMYVKDRNAEDFKDQFPDACDAIVNKHYVDDYFDSTDTVGEAVQRASAVRFIHLKAGFEIRNWVSNAPEFLRQISQPEETEKVCLDSSKPDRVLGIVCETKRDNFTFVLKVRNDLSPYVYEERVPTKRIVLSCVMSLFDPLGFITPFTFFGKVLIQTLWRSGCDWDQTINEQAAVDWKRWTKHLVDVAKVEIPRYYFGDGLMLEYSTLQLHIFVDASESAYGCAGYFRIMAGEVPRCALVQAKSKVTPLKLVSIPRLELMAAVLGIRLAESIKANHNFLVKDVFYWTDSSTVHSWIISEQRKYKSFVAFRIGEIISRSKPSQWNWIRGKGNVTDHLTKWKVGPHIGEESPWFRGPKFLYESSMNWPQQLPKTANVQEEMRATFLLHTIEIQGSLMDVSRISKWNVLIRTLACVNRFIYNIRAKCKGKPIVVVPATSKIKAMALIPLPSIQKSLSREEYQVAERILWKMAQADGFPDEVRVFTKIRQDDCSSSMKIERNSSLFKLSPIMDEFGIIRMEGRTKPVEFIPFELRFPIVLPKGHLITRKLIEHYHHKMGHAGRETVVNELRQRFYIQNIRMELSKVMKACVWCKIKRCRPVIPRMAPLPAQRVTSNLRPFSFTGVDFFGPIIVSVGRRSEKRWVALFTCLTTRAIHLEVAHSLSSQSCLMAIRRFACRRGFALEFFSDQGTNFVAASKEVMKTIIKDCCEVYTDARTKWSFNPPSAPHMGGAWERLVRSTKQALSVLDDGRRLTDELLLTVLAEAEDVINSRPLTYVPQESADGEALSPNHFLRGYPSSGAEGYPEAADEAAALRDQYKRSQWLAKAFWKRWLLEYLPLINKRSKWHEEREPIQEGEIVYMADDDNRRNWLRGIVVEVIRGLDGRIRQAVIRTTKGTYRRPVAKLAVPEIRNRKSGCSQEFSPDVRGGAVEVPPGPTSKYTSL